MNCWTPVRKPTAAPTRWGCDMRRIQLNTTAPFGACLLAKPRKRPMARYRRDEAPFAAVVELTINALAYGALISFGLLMWDQRHLFLA